MEVYVSAYRDAHHVIFFGQCEHILQGVMGQLSDFKQWQFEHVIFIFRDKVESVFERVGFEIIDGIHIYNYNHYLLR